MEPVKIRWDTGYMLIDPDQFFPTSIDRVKKLNKLIRLDAQQEEIRRQLVQGLIDRAQQILDGRRAIAQAAVQHHTKAAELQAPIDATLRRIASLQACIQENPRLARSAGYSARVKGEKACLKEQRAQQRAEVRAFNDKKREFEAAAGLAEKLRKNAEVIR